MKTGPTKTLTIVVVALIILATNSCSSKKTNTENSDLWSVKMANSIMQTSDRLIDFETKNNPLRSYDTSEWDYDVGFVAFAVRKLKNIDPKYAEYSDAYINHFIQDDGSILNYQKEEYNVDKVYPGINLFDLYNETGEEKYKIAIDTLVEQMKSHPKTDSGGYWHKNIYPNQMWLDGIFMASPFLTRYAFEFNQPEWYDVVAHQILLVYNKTFDESTGLLYHAQDESLQQKWADPETGRSSFFWGRAIGWYVMAIVDILDYFPEDHPQRPQIIDIYKGTIEALLMVRDQKTGVWFQILDMPEHKGNYPEGSCTAMYTYAIAKGAKKGYLPKNYLDLADDCFDSMINTLVKVEDDGKVILTNICGGAGLGGNPYRDGSFEYYVSEQIVPNDCKGVAPFILAAIELNR